VAYAKIWYPEIVEPAPAPTTPPTVIPPPVATTSPVVPPPVTVSAGETNLAIINALAEAIIKYANS
jgi:hypothetical protein